MQANVLVGGLIACSVAILSLWQQRRRADTKLVEAKRQLDAERRNRASERTGRIRAEVQTATTCDTRVYGVPFGM